MIRVKGLILLGTLLLMLILASVASLVFGARFVPLSEVVETFLNHGDKSLEQLVVLERVPRTVFGIIAGAALGVSGALMQAVTRNPIADPSILGVNTGASLFVVIGIAYLNISKPMDYIGLAMLGAILTAAFVYAIGALGAGGATPIKLALAGAATSAALSSLVSAVILPRTDVMNIYRFWQVGSISGATYEGIQTMLPFLLVGFILAAFTMTGLNALALGDELATGLGSKTLYVRLAAAGSGVLLCGATTALAGPIGFVGLMVPHIIRLLAGPNHRIIIPFSALTGATILLVSDVLGRLIGSPGELEAGIVTAFLGAPILIRTALRSKVSL